MYSSLFFFNIFLSQILMSARQKRPTVLMAATTHQAPTPVCVTLPMSWDLMGNSATVSLNSPNIVACLMFDCSYKMLTHIVTVNL